MLKLALAIGFLSVFGFVAFAMVVWIYNYLKSDKKEEKQSE